MGTKLSNLIQAFILTRQWRDTPNGIALEFWCASDNGPVCIEVTQQEAVAFVRHKDLPRISLLLKPNHFRRGNNTFKNYRDDAICPIYFNSYRSARDTAFLLEKHKISVWEADIRPPERFLMERFITGSVTIAGAINPSTQHRPYHYSQNPALKNSEFSPALRGLSIDIETTMDASALYSIAAFNASTAKVFIVQSAHWSDETSSALHHQNDRDISVYATEKACLSAFIQWLNRYDPDLIIGWNVIQFDLKILDDLCKKNNVAFALGRNAQVPQWREDKTNRRYYVTVPGRVILDGIEVLRSANYNFASFKLNDVAQEILNDSKLLTEQNRGDAITALYHHNPEALARYNVHDCKLVWEIFEQTKLIEFALARSQLTGLAMDRMGGSVAAFEFAYLPQLHRKGYIAPNLGELHSSVVSPGGYVLDSTPGIYRNVLVLDFKSLYPSIIRTFCIDPYSYWYAQHNNIAEEQKITGFNDAFFTKHEHLLPDIIEALWRARDQAKTANNQPLSHAIKIIMNSFYGVLGSTGCRFFDPRVCSSITLRGHQIIQQTKTWIEQSQHRVIYGDTDSVFVWIGNDYSESEALDIGRNLAQTLNDNWRQKLRDDYRISSALEIEFETHYLKFLMPTIRNSSLGSKKRYAGVIRKNAEQHLVFKGLENVRTDWTPLAKQFQERLYQLIFENANVERFIREVTADVLAGKRDPDLVYRKRLRRNLEDYQKNIPPHVQAAKKLSARGTRVQRGDWISYILTASGPEPVVDKHALTRLHGQIAYQEYVERQLKPVADSILQFVGLSFEAITAAQLPLFD
ncbi:MAG TPA: DNA polymerase II [Marinagarivorans sp.]